ncbi:LysR substrate-binding domain-containing protein [Pelagibaculum spongiae]|uniref:HTH lysR-type domain-containing protein n=1 Tax=Pelagibaculum spongiae TaxID=2080658 RepID=A0A2V1GUZ9_9GAMM|nr:LysR substrate-binding domain-containing protein [Pelagibaculum spongiae]PVZ70168.1 hypothetical protein DC094_06080 [Pelagibaculum spongiae]
MKRRLPSLNAIRAFESAARLSSITDAADELSVTPTAISHQIRHLENLIDIKLFERSGRKIKLTAQGQKILPMVTKGMDYLAFAFEEVYGGFDENNLSISTTREFALYWLQPRLDEFYAENPKIVLNIHTSEKCADLEHNEIDIAIRYGAIPDEESDSTVLFQEHYIPVANKKNITQKKLNIKISDLTKKRLIDVLWEKTEMNAPTWEKWFNQCETEDYSSYHLMAFDAYNLAFDALRRGHGAALLSSTIVSSEEFSDDFVQLEGPKLPGYYYRLITTRQGKKKLSATRFTQWLLSKIN